jgi:hypothetical protein
MIKNFQPQLAERGKIKIGERGEQKQSSQGKTFAQPRKLDHFVITTLQRDSAGRLQPDTALMSKLAKNGKLTEIPVRLLYDDIDLNFLTRYACYRGARCWCSGDGESAQRLNGTQYQSVPCPCERLDPLYAGQDKCKVMGTLQLIIEGTDRIGGVWKFRTTSWNSTNAILSSLLLIRSITGGPLAGIPLWLVLTPKTVTVPGSGQTMLIQMVSLEYRGSQQQLAELGLAIARQRIEHKVRMEEIENQARRMLAPPQAEPLAEQVDTAAEFFPAAASPEEVTAVADLVARQVAAQAEDDFLAAAPPPSSQAALELEPVPAPVQEMEGTIPPALLRQIEHQAKLKGIPVPEFSNTDEAKKVLKDLMAQ